MHLKSLLPAIPTVCIAALLAIDFDGMVSGWYLWAIVIVPGFSVLALLLYGACALITKRYLSTAATTFLTLFLASLVFHACYVPAAGLVRNLTPYNDVVVSVEETYKNQDQVDWTIVARGKGAKDDFTFRSGYANGFINGSYQQQVSLDFALNPQMQIELQAALVPADERAIVAAFAAKGLEAFASPEYASQFQARLRELASIHNMAAADRAHIEPEFYPDRNLVYRLMFATASVFALLFSALVTANHQGAS